MTGWRRIVTKASMSPPSSVRCSEQGGGDAPVFVAMPVQQQPDGPAQALEIEIVGPGQRGGALTVDTIDDVIRCADEHHFALETTQTDHGGGLRRRSYGTQFATLRPTIKRVIAVFGREAGAAAWQAKHAADHGMPGLMKCGASQFSHVDRCPKNARADDRPRPLLPPLRAVYVRFPRRRLSTNHR